MSFLRRLRGGAQDPANGPHGAATRTLWAVNPDWVQGITPAEFERICQIVATELGPAHVPNKAHLRDFANAAELMLPRLIPLLAQSPRAGWPKLLHSVLEGNRVNREAGERVEAASQTFESAREHLRIHWMPAAMAPEGDVVVPGLLPDTVDGLALDAGPSVRHLSQRLFDRWGVPVEDVVAAAHERVLELPLERWDFAKELSPALKAISTAKEGPYIGPIVRDIARVDPSAIGLFGTIVGAPVDSAIVYRALDDAPGLRRDLALLVVAMSRVLDTQTAGDHEFLKLPVWRRSDGTAEPVTFTFEGDTEATFTVTGSHSPSFEGVLTALDPLEQLPVPGWAQGVLHRSAYTRFAGCVAAVRGVYPREVALLGSAYSLGGLVAQCRTLSFDEWPAVIAAHIEAMRASESAAKTVIDAASFDADSLRGNLVTWLEDSAAVAPGVVSRPFLTPGLSEVLGIHVDGHAVPVPAATAALAGYPDELFSAGRERIRGGLTVARDGQIVMLSGRAQAVRGQPSPLSAIAEVLTWLPDLCGPYGALVGAGSADRFTILPISDASAVLDVPHLLGLAAGSATDAPWAITPHVFWVSADRVAVFRVQVTMGIVTALAAPPDLASIVARLPEPATLPAGLAEMLGPDRARRFYSQLRAVVVDLLAADPLAITAEFTPVIVRDLAASCRDVPPQQWPEILRRDLRERAAPRGELDQLSVGSYHDASSRLLVRVARADQAGSQLARDVKGGLVAFPCLHVMPRWRRVTLAMLEAWGVTADQCYADALAATAVLPDLVDQPMFPDAPLFVRAIYAEGMEIEAIGLALHLRYPGSRRGFVVSITHGSRAHYLRLDDEGAAKALPGFATAIAGIYEAADAAADALSSWLVWLTPDGRILELLDARRPFPGPEGLPPEFVAMIRAGTAARLN